MLSPFRLSQPAAKGIHQRNWGDFMDDHGGLIPRWEVLFNITILRLISFNLDYYWSLNLPGASPVEVGPSVSIRQTLLMHKRRNSSIHRISLSVTE